jgi:Asp-tRNA(Asn)/Glu-tRNA(Gln) amidotransferase A subunit family amidase
MLSAALGTQVIGSTIRPASYCGCIGFKASVGALNRGGSYDGLSQSATGVLAATLEDAWQVAYEIAVRAGGDPGYPGLFGPAGAPAPRKPRRLAFLETAGWDAASTGAKAAMADALARIKSAGIELATSQSHAKVAAVAAAIKGARALSMRINAWEWRWPLNTYRERDAKKLSQALLDRLAEAERMSLDQYREDLAERDKVRTRYAELAPDCDACIGLSAPAAAPSGLGSSIPRCSASPRSLSPCYRMKGYRSACRLPDSSIAMPRHSLRRPRSRYCSSVRRAGFQINSWIENACEHAGRPFDPDIRSILRLGGLCRLIEGR